MRNVICIIAIMPSSRLFATSGGRGPGFSAAVQRERSDRLEHDGQLGRGKRQHDYAETAARRKVAGTRYDAYLTDRSKVRQLCSRSGIQV